MNPTLHARATLASLALAVFGLSGCTTRAPESSHTEPQASGTPTNARPHGTPTAFPIGFNANRVGSKYVYFTKQKQNRKVYVLRADSENGQYMGQNTGRTTFVNPHVIFYGQAGKRLVADAPTGTVVERDKTVRMTGGVRATSADGLTLRSDTLRYDDQNDTVHGEGNVVVTTPQGEQLQGETLDWNLRDGAIAVNGAH